MPWWIVENTLLAAILALLVALVSRIRRVPPVVRHGLWLVVLIKLIVPPVFSLGISVPGAWAGVAQVVEEFRAGEVREAEPLEEVNRQVRLDPPADLRPPLAGASEIEVFSSDSLADFEIEPGTAEPPRVALADAQAPRSGGSEAVRRRPVLPISIATLLFWGSATGSLAVTLVQVLRLVRIWRLLHRAAGAPAEFTTFVAGLAAELEVRPPAVRVSAEIQSPFVCALGRPVLAWPASGLASLRDSARRAVIVHELAHLARRDHWIGWIELAASCGWWWNPLFWYVRHQIHENAELACDTWVTGLFPESRRAYANALVDVAELDSLTTAAGPALGVGDGSRKLFERRLVMIMGDRVNYRMGALGFIGMGLLTLAALPGCSAGFAAEEPVFTDALPVQNLSGPAPEVNLADPRALLGDPLTGPVALPDSNSPTVQTAPATLPSAAALDNPLDDSDPSNIPPAERAAPVLPPATRGQELESNDERMKRLEDRLESLLMELRELKSSGTNKDPNSKAGAQPGPKKVSTVYRDEYRKAVTAALTAPKTMTPQTGAATKTPLDMVTKAPQTITYHKARLEMVTLERTTYTLPPGKADELAVFFKQSLTDEIEVRVKGDSLIVTARPDDQAPIAGFIRLVQSRGAEPTKTDTKGQHSIRPSTP